ncbi:Glycosyl transferase family 2 [Desulfacinum infernum DSM 9756]|uniref:Glycosyl transferase family 2 n=1 Tax=Desulfacinum infernum DSM 9756 TaxID=1121391 RepID=A0A1M5CSI6_9BACT|nr:glycosyltransferase family 2 protein [Desulfacinum infernum]SHF57715.1 Glycosyl transferase family 2 [Desulfacinum infernum DSM 9756]
MNMTSRESSNPLISVILPVFNAENFVEESIESILSQTANDLELIVIDDGSEDGSWEKIRAAASRDGRIRPLRNKKNRGLIYTLNKGLLESKGFYVARMDADDISLPDRLASQIEFMKEHNVDFCGCWIRLLGSIRKRVICFPETDIGFKTLLLFQTPFSHPTLVMRRKIIHAGFRYRSDAVHAEEYDLAVQLAKYYRMGNVPKVLLLYRVHKSQVSNLHRRTQLESAARIRREALRALEIPADPEQVYLHGYLRYPKPVASFEELRAYRNWLETLCLYFEEKEEAKRVVAEQWLRVCIRATHLGPRVVNEYRQSFLLRYYDASYKQQADLLLASLFRLRYGSRMFQMLESLSLSPGF